MFLRSPRVCIALFAVTFLLIPLSNPFGETQALFAHFATSPSSFAPTNDFEVSNKAELEAALTQVQDGQTILLTDGSFGALSIWNRQNATGITLAAKPGHSPQFTEIKIQDSSHWTLDGVHVQPRFESGADGKTALTISGSHVTIENARINYAEDISGWTAADWLGKAGNGISISGSDHIVRNNEIKNVDHGINANADNSLIAHNTIFNLRGDGMRTLGDDVVVEYNVIKNCYNVDDNHDDGIQSWSVGESGVGTGVVRNVTLSGNIIINYEDPNQPFQGAMQGIGLFDGTFENWTIENNLVVVDHWHGISMYGARDSLIINNTVLDINDTEPGPPWIRVNPHKNGTLSTNMTVRNNLTTKLALQESGVISENNILISDLADHFVDAAARDYRLIAGSSAIDAGSATDAPAIDLDGISRPQGAGVDVGAFEYITGGATNTPTPMTPDAIAITPTSTPAPPTATPVPSTGRPDASNTGYKGPLTPYTGPSTITEDGTVLENFSYNGTLKIEADNVTLRNFFIDSTGFYGIDAKYDAIGLLIEDGEIAHTQSAAVIGSNFTARRLHIRDQGADAFKPFANALIEGNYIHNLGSIPDSHSDGVQMVSGSNVVIRGNHFAPSDGTGYKTSQVIIIQTNNGPVDNISIEDNWIYDGGWAIQVRDKGNGYGPPTNVSIIGNRFGNDHRFGTWVTNGEVAISCNVWDESGALIDGQADCDAPQPTAQPTSQPTEEATVQPTTTTPPPASTPGSSTIPDPTATPAPTAVQSGEKLFMPVVVK